GVEVGSSLAVIALRNDAVAHEARKLGRAPTSAARKGLLRARAAASLAGSVGSHARANHSLDHGS
ncbi:MAG: hypothetical protein ACYSUI_25380, partial [Planctomycetota bacterium]